MLLNLVVTNFAIIERLEVEFGPGFNVLTGETGAGKSIILDALGLLLGDRARPDLVRAGAAEATVEALFAVSGQPQVTAALEKAGLPPADDGELILRRTVQAGGRSRAYVNGSLVTLAQLQPLTERLVSVCGQHEHQGLMQRGTHLALLDHYGKHLKQADDYRQLYSRLQQVSQRLEQLQQADRDRQQRLDFLRHQSEEIGQACLCPEEEESLQSERLLLQNAERLASLAQQGFDALYAAEGAVCERLGSLADELSGVAAVDAELEALAEQVRKSQLELEDVAVQLRQKLGRMDFEPGRQDQVESRLDELAKLKRKYAPNLEEILALKQELDAEIVTLENAEETRDELERQKEQLEADLLPRGQRLSKLRRAAAGHLAGALSRELSDLAMPGARFEAALADLPEPGLDGLEKIEFMVSPNPGEPLMSLAKVASGGELSRLMLALKRVAPEADEIPTIVFDEVDAGIGGAAATSVGRKLHAVSDASQVLCVTHLPQVAAFADRQYRVIKQEVGGRTLTDLRYLSAEERVEEMARMLGGAQVTEQTLLHAREMIEASGAAQEEAS